MSRPRIRARVGGPRGRGQRGGRGDAFVSTPLPSVSISAPSNISTTTTTTASISPLSGGATLEAVLEQIRSATDLISGIDRRIRSLDERTTRLSSALKELNDMMKRHCKDSFTIKGSAYEAPLKHGMAKLFCESLQRKPNESDVQATVVDILGRDARERFKFDLAFSYAKNKLTEFRTDERRKVCGIVPYERSCFLDTTALSQNITNSMQPADETDIDTYTKHLAILRKFVRDSGRVPPNFYTTFREWLDNFYSELNEDVWRDIMDEDADISYVVVGSGIQSSADTEIVDEDNTTIQEHN